MKRNKVLSIGFVVCTVVLVLTVVTSIKTIVGFAGISLPNEEKYNIGDAVIGDKINNLDIDWTEGKVNIEYHSDETVEISEKSKKTISEDKKMRWQVEDGTLRIRYEKPGIHLLSFTSLQKELTVTLPEGIALDNVNIDATSAELNIPDLQAQDLNLDVTSGEIHAAAKAQRVTAGATSGDIYLEIMEDAETISVSSTSGSISIEGNGADKVSTGITSGSIDVVMKNVADFKADTTSGTINADIEEAQTVKVESTSGDVNVSFAGIKTLDIDSTSGDITALLPEEPGFTARVEKTSGDFEYDLPLTKEGNAYICGDGSAEVKISVTSGDIKIGSSDK